MQFVSKMTLSRLKFVIYESQILRTTNKQIVLTKSSSILGPDTVLSSDKKSQRTYSGPGASTSSSSSMEYCGGADGEKGYHTRSSVSSSQTSDSPIFRRSESASSSASFPSSSDDFDDNIDMSEDSRRASVPYSRPSTSSSQGLCPTCFGDLSQGKQHKSCGRLATRQKNLEKILTEKEKEQGGIYNYLDKKGWAGGQSIVCLSPCSGCTVIKAVVSS